MATVVIPLLAAIVGALVGGVATYMATNVGIQRSADAAQRLAKQQHAWERQDVEKERAEQRQNVRTLIWLENEHNLAALNAFWQEVTSVLRPPGPNLSYSTEEATFLQRYRLATVLLPPWGHLMWESQAANLSPLGDDVIRKCYQFHVDLEQFSSERAKVQTVFESGEGAIVWTLYTSWRNKIDSEFVQGRDSAEHIPADAEKGYMRLIERTQPMWDECQRIYELHHVNNPIAQDNAPGK